MTNQGELITLQDCLENVETLESHLAVALPEEEIWGLQTRCALVDPNSVDDPDASVQIFGTPFQLTLSVATVQEIVGNARAQVAEVATDKLLEAFLFYFDNDAFISF